MFHDDGVKLLSVKKLGVSSKKSPTSTKQVSAWPKQSSLAVNDSSVSINLQSKHICCDIMTIILCLIQVRKEQLAFTAGIIPQKKEKQDQVASQTASFSVRCLWED